MELINTESFEKIDENFIVKRSQIEKKIGHLKDSHGFTIESRQGNRIPVQFDDIDSDGKWDEMVFQFSLRPNQIEYLILKMVSLKELPCFTKKTQAYLGVSRNRDGNFSSFNREIRPKNHVAQSRPMLYQYEGVGWENDKVAFRSYFDSRNGKDIFGKCIPNLVLDSVGLPGKDYHELSTWGMDILKVGNSLGAGSLALYRDSNFYRLGETDSAIVTLIANGPVRSVVQLEYKGWKIGVDDLNVKEIITIWSGKYYYQSDVTITGNSNGGSIVSGIVNLKDVDSSKRICSPHVKMEYICSYSVQSENHDKLGMAILYAKGDKKELIDLGKESDPIKIGSTYSVLFNSGNTARFMFFAGWEKSTSLFTSKKGFQSIVDKEAMLIGSPSILKLL